ncbi:MAG: sodium:alanine symporter family protein [Chlamydia sp. 32-24]|nr:MAG: sodium:alanine symporter family protein [Chlamydia sp. 32-24]
MINLIELLKNCKDFLWGVPLLLLLLGTGLYLTFLLKGVQFRYLFYGIKQALTFEKNDSKGDIHPFQALMTSLAGAIGTGTIVGVATSIAIGGLGAIFWMWVTAIVGMATKYAESLLAVKYRKEINGEMAGGPMQYMEVGLGWKKAAIFFAIVGSLAALTTGNLVQMNAISDAINQITEVNSLWIGIFLAALTGMVVIGGVKSIGKVASVLVPIMALFYMAGGLIILILHFDKIGTVFLSIMKGAFSGQAAFGGFSGATLMLAIQMGVSRGIFSNEAGLGISSMAAAAAKTDLPGKQALITMVGALISTIIICTMTGLVLGVTEVLGKFNENGIPLTGAAMATTSFNYLYGGKYIVAIGLIFFAFSTVIAWGYYGEKCFEYLFGSQSILYYRVLFACIAIPGATMKMDIAWYLADITNALMVIPNLFALLALGSVIHKETEHFERITSLESEQTSLSIEV